MKDWFEENEDTVDPTITKDWMPEQLPENIYWTTYSGYPELMPTLADIIMGDIQ